MKPFIHFFFLLTLVPLVAPLGELPVMEDDDNDGVIDDSPETLTSSESASLPFVTGDVTAEDGPMPPAVVAAPLDPLPAMSVPLARPPGFRPPTSFKSKKDSGDHTEHVNVGFVVRRGRAKVMGFSRRKTETD
ncbi:unnamed protein product [Caenorhabditis sp. 36 PRJEB53466]|nr:unnamed protein product [Caenorhabditis sp. 36 PRJEB53466]